MNPSVKKTWALAGQTPVVVYRNRHHKKVSVLGAIVYEPAQQKISAICDFYPGSYVRAPEAVAFLQRLLAEFPDRRLDVVWDNLNAHRAKLVKALVAEHSRLHLHYLPPYAPELNPSEMLWCLSKHHRMANHAIDDLEELEREAKRVIQEVVDQPHLLRSCFKHASLAL